MGEEDVQMGAVPAEEPKAMKTAVEPETIHTADGDVKMGGECSEDVEKREKAARQGAHSFTSHLLFHAHPCSPTLSQLSSTLPMPIYLLTSESNRRD